MTVHRVHRACILLELIDHETGQVRAQGIDIVGPGAEADVVFEEKYHFNTNVGDVVHSMGFYAVAVRGKGRMFHIDFDWPEPPTTEQRSIANG